MPPKEVQRTGPTAKKDNRPPVLTRPNSTDTIGSRGASALGVEQLKSSTGVQPSKSATTGVNPSKSATAGVTKASPRATGSSRPRNSMNGATTNMPSTARSSSTTAKTVARSSTLTTAGIARSSSTLTGNLTGNAGRKLPFETTYSAAKVQLQGESEKDRVIGYKYMLNEDNVVAIRSKVLGEIFRDSHIFAKKSTRDQQNKINDCLKLLDDLDIELDAADLERETLKRHLIAQKKSNKFISYLQQPLIPKIPKEIRATEETDYLTELQNEFASDSEVDFDSVTEVSEENFENTDQDLMDIMGQDFMASLGLADIEGKTNEDKVDGMVESKNRTKSSHKKTVNRDTSDGTSLDTFYTTPIGETPKKSEDPFSIQKSEDHESELVLSEIYEFVLQQKAKKDGKSEARADGTEEEDSVMNYDDIQNDDGFVKIDIEGNVIHDHDFGTNFTLDDSGEERVGSALRDVLNFKHNNWMFHHLNEEEDGEDDGDDAFLTKDLSTKDHQDQALDLNGSPLLKKRRKDLLQSRLLLSEKQKQKDEPALGPKLKDMDTLDLAHYVKMAVLEEAILEAERLNQDREDESNYRRHVNAAKKPKDVTRKETEAIEAGLDLCRHLKREHQLQENESFANMKDLAMRMHLMREDTKSFECLNGDRPSNPAGLGAFPGGTGLSRSNSLARTASNRTSNLDRGGSTHGGGGNANNSATTGGNATNSATTGGNVNNNATVGGPSGSSQNAGSSGKAATGSGNQVTTSSSSAMNNYGVLSGTTVRPNVGNSSLFSKSDSHRKGGGKASYGGSRFGK